MITMFYGCAWMPDEVTAELRDAMGYHDSALEWGRFSDDDEGIFLAVRSTTTIEVEDTIQVPLLKLSVIPFRADEWNRLLASFLEAAGMASLRSTFAWTAVWRESA